MSAAKKLLGPDTPWATQAAKKLGPDTPWAMQVVKDKRSREPRVEPVYKPRPTPWAPAKPANQDEPVFAPFVPRDEDAFLPIPALAPEQPEIPEKRPVVSTKLPAMKRPVGPFQHAISAQNYAAVESKRGEYGLIDMGLAYGSARSLVVHASSRKTPDVWRVLNAVRPGCRLLVKPVTGGPACSLRVRYTTPARYYSPGAKVTSLAIAVDDTDWASLMADARRI
jgi:hypothetical protein